MCACAKIFMKAFKGISGACCPNVSSIFALINSTNSKKKYIARSFVCSRNRSKFDFPFNSANSTIQF